MATYLGAQPEQIRYLRHDGCRQQAADWLRTQLHLVTVAVTRWSTIPTSCGGSEPRLETGASSVIPPLTKEGDLDLSAAEQLLPQVRLAAAAHSSNVLGTVNDIPALAKLTRKARWICRSWTALTGYLSRNCR